MSYYDRKKNIEFYKKKMVVNYKQSNLDPIAMGCSSCGMITVHDIVQRNYQGDVTGVSQLRTCRDCNHVHRFDFLRGKNVEKAFQDGYLSWK